MNNMAKINETTTLAKGKFLELQRISFTNDDGKELQWEACQRVNKVNAVSMFAIRPRAKAIVLVRQFRAPIGKYCIECPAGLIEGGETVMESARRELLEETGYTIGRVLDSGVAAENSAGMTGELTTPIVVLIDENVPRKNQRMDAAEHIEILEVPINKLCNFLKRATENGDVVSGKLLAFSYGMRITF